MEGESGTATLLLGELESLLGVTYGTSYPCRLKFRQKFRLAAGDTCYNLLQVSLRDPKYRWPIPQVFVQSHFPSPGGCR